MSTAINTRASWKVVKPSLIPRPDKSRRGAKARSWTAQEESYLLDCRDRRLPYRRIATQLNKTELACRLHYHQLTVVRARPVEEVSSNITTAALSPETAASTCDGDSPKSVHEQLTASPEAEHRYLPRHQHTRQDTYSSCYDNRSTSLPTPTPSRGSPHSITSQCSPDHHHHNHHEHRRPSAPSCLPSARQPSPRLPPLSAGLGLSALLPHSTTTNATTHQRNSSYPPHNTSTTKVQQYFPPTPKTSHDDKPAAAAAAAAAYYASQWGQWTSRRFPVPGPVLLETGRGESGVVGQRQRHGGDRAVERRASEGRGSGLDRCSVSALLNP